VLPSNARTLRFATDERGMGLAKHEKETKKALRLVLILRETNSEDWVVHGRSTEISDSLPSQNDGKCARFGLKGLPGKIPVDLPNKHRPDHLCFPFRILS
jgi:hypothetical protein